MIRISYKLYELVVRHFLACVSKDAQGDETTIKISIANENVCFIKYCDALICHSDCLV